MSKTYSKRYLYLRAVIYIISTFFLLGFSSILVFVLMILSLGQLQNQIIEHYGKFLGRAVLKVAGVKMRVKYVSGKVTQPAIYISNHSSTVDLFVIIGLGLPRIRFVAKYELQYNPLFFILGRVTGQVFIKRQQTEKAVKILRKTYERVKKQRLSLYVAPEGTRKHPGKIGPFKKGAFRMAIDLGYPIVPMYFEGASELCPVNSLLVRPGEVTVWIHPPIDTSNWKIETLDEHIESVRKLYLQWAKQEKAFFQPA